MLFGFQACSVNGKDEVMLNSLGAKSIRVAVVLVVAASLGACGVKSSPSRPEGSQFPKQYPTPLKPVVGLPDKPDKTQAPATNPDDFYQYPNQRPAQ